MLRAVYGRGWGGMRRGEEGDVGNTAEIVKVI